MLSVFLGKGSYLDKNVLFCGDFLTEISVILVVLVLWTRSSGLVEVANQMISQSRIGAAKIQKCTSLKICTLAAADIIDTSKFQCFFSRLLLSRPVTTCTRNNQFCDKF